MSETDLDALIGALLGAPEDMSARLKFYARLADSEVFLLLDEEVESDRVVPQVFDLSDGRFVLVFDTADRLAGFARRSQAYLSLTGRALADMLAGQDLGIALNADGALPFFMPPDAVSWLRETTGDTPAIVPARIVAVLPMRDMPDALLDSLDTKMTAAAGLAQTAYLAAVRYDTGAEGHLLGFVEAVAGAQPALARAANEALRFSGLAAGALDVGFFAQADAIVDKLARLGLRIDLPQSDAASHNALSAPGLDPSRPPRLR